MTACKDISGLDNLTSISIIPLLLLAYSVKWCATNSSSGWLVVIPNVCHLHLCLTVLPESQKQSEGRILGDHVALLAAHFVPNVGVGRVGGGVGDMNMGGDRMMRQGKGLGLGGNAIAQCGHCCLSLNATNSLCLAAKRCSAVAARALNDVSVH